MIDPVGMLPRDYQIRAVERLRDAIGGGSKRIVLVSPTGSGKTFMSSMLIHSAVAKGKSVLFLAHRRELVVQKSKTLMKFDVPHGLIQSGMATDSQHQVQVASKDTLHARAIRRERMYLPPADVIIADECHRSLAKTWQGLFNQYPNAVIIGLTATPVLGRGTGLGGFYQDMVIAATSPELVACGALVPTIVYAPHRPNLKGVKCSGGDYIQKQLEGRMNTQTLVGDVLSQWKRLGQDRLTVGFASGIAHSIHLRDTFLADGIKAGHVDGNMEDAERDDILGQLADGKIQVLFNAMVLTEGWDCPQVSCCIMARPTKSFGLFLQCCGRIQRLFPGKTDAILIDHAGAVHEHGFPDDAVPWTLDENEKIEDRIAKQRSKPEDPREPRQLVCEKCKAVFRATLKCPRCGHMAERKGREVKTEKGELERLERDKINRNATMHDKQKHWDDCLGEAIGRGRSLGYAAHRYKDKFGVFPNNALINVPRGSEWQMSALSFYDQVVKPAKALAKAATQYELKVMF